MAALRDRLRFFHWPAEFPDVFLGGGFDCILGNPPWDQLQCDPQEFFVNSKPSIAGAKTMAKRERLIQQLQTEDIHLYDRYRSFERRVFATQAFIHHSGRYSFANYGRLNSAPLFTELCFKLIRASSRVGLVVPSGIVSDEFSRHLFNHMIGSGKLLAFYGFENEDKLFAGIANVVRFALLIGAGSASPAPTQFAFYLRHPAELLSVRPRTN